MLAVAVLLVGLGGLWWSGVLAMSGTVIEESAGNSEGGGVEAAAQRTGASGSATASRDGANGAEGDTHDRRRTAYRSVAVSLDNGSVHRLRLKVFLGAGRPLTKGTVDCRIWIQERVARQLKNAQLILDGSNEAHVELKNLPDRCPKVSMALRYVESRPGRTDRSWLLEMTIAGPVGGEPWVAPDCVLLMQEQELLCKGAVLDGDGQPVPGCVLTWRDETSRRWRTSFGPVVSMGVYLRSADGVTGTI